MHYKLAHIPNKEAFIANFGCKYKHQAKALEMHSQDLERFLKRLFIEGKEPALGDCMTASELLAHGEKLRTPAEPCIPKVICVRQDVLEHAFESYQNLKNCYPKEKEATTRENKLFVDQDSFLCLGAALNTLLA